MEETGKNYNFHANLHIHRHNKYFIIIAITTAPMWRVSRAESVLPCPIWRYFDFLMSCEWSGLSVQWNAIHYMKLLCDLVSRII